MPKTQYATYKQRCIELEIELDRFKKHGSHEATVNYLLDKAGVLLAAAKSLSGLDDDDDTTTPPTDEP